MKMPKLCEIIDGFKDSCKLHGWKTSENEDWIKTGDEYHNFLWVKDVNSSSFQNIVASKKCAIREGLFYRVVKATYIAWLFPETPSETLTKIIFESPELSKTIAFYDLSPVLEGKKFCCKINFTDSLVFQEFENFLEKELNVRVKPLFAQEPNERNFTVAELA
jgi:hypothetical protein